MHILDMKVAGLGDCPDTGRITAKVILLTSEGGVSLAAATDPADQADRRAILEGLLNDALRQIKAFPEVRTGQKRLTVAEDALNREMQEG
ncbi:hypothetical protein [Roseovarius sp. MMSF_3281]|uniref:hypothetical protein n=1 Tax=Roseovarius sp. MMSF_3281 TaxID=3046694 RepID=UPI00273CF90B|nr:hypothetical protein [Roseovarius sp. MMSF_3281]